MNLLECQWKEKLCPFETVKKWKQGYSIKCPRSSEVCWCQNKDESIIRHIEIKRSRPACLECRMEMGKFSANRS